MPNVTSSKETALVAGEDARIRTLMHDAKHIRQPQTVRYPGALPTLVLPPRVGGYTAADLVQQGALVMQPGGIGLLQESVFVEAGTQLSLGAPALTTLYLASGGGGFTSIVGWGGDLSFAGTAARPLTITGWVPSAKSAAADKGDGRAYIREIGATMTIAYARVSSLGFWSGRTGGVAWTGTSRSSSTGGAHDSTFTGDTYGAFVSRGRDVTFSADRFESNELDGLHIHRYSVGAQVTSSSAARNGGSGFLVDRATTNTVLRGDVSVHNAANGYLFDGRPLVSGASASGGSNAPSSGTALTGSSAAGNAHTSVLIEGGTGTVVKSDQFCSPTTAVALRAGATNSVVTGDYIGCAPRSGISVGPSAAGTVIYGNIVSRPGIGLLIRSSGPVSMYDNRIIGATVFGVSARGAASRVNGVGNVMSGTGDRAVDARTVASVSGLSGTDTSGWAHNARVTFVSYLEFHPLASLWLGILVVILLAAGWSFRRKLPSHPYPASVRRPYQLTATGETSIAMKPHPAHLRHSAGQPAPRPARPPAGWNGPAWPRAGGPRPTGPQPGVPQPGGLRPSGPLRGVPQPSGLRPSGPQPGVPQPGLPQPGGLRPSGPLRGVPQPSGLRPSGPLPGLPQPGLPRADGPPSPPRLPPYSQPERAPRHRPAYHDPVPSPGWRHEPAPEPALPPAGNPAPGRQRPGPPGEDARVTRPIPKGVWD
jgi:Right handed beta helix region